VSWVQVLPHEGFAFPELPCSWSLAYMQGSQPSGIGQCNSTYYILLESQRENLGLFLCKNPAITEETLDRYPGFSYVSPKISVSNSNFIPGL